MSWSLSSILLSSIFLIALKFLADVSRQERRKRQMPPGPPALPIVGNAHQLTKLPFIRFAEWGQQYGPIFSLHIAGQPVVVLSDFTVAADLIDRCSSIYSDRPKLVMADLMSKGLVLPLTPYGDLWRNMRKAAHDGFNTHAVKDYQRLQQEAAYRLLNTLLSSSCEDGWAHDIENSFAWTLLSITYGLTLTEARKRRDIVCYVQDITQRIASAALPGSSWIDIFPALEHVPKFMNPWKIKAEKAYQNDTRILTGLVNDVRAKVASGNAARSFCADLIEFNQDAELTEAQVAWLSGAMYVAGVGTTSTVMEVFFLAMILYPEVMRRAQQEIDAVVGHGRLPSFDDAGDLPYINALIREVMRWRPPVPLSIPRRCSRDDFYKGYFIPKGTIVMPNVWAMHRDPKHFTEPEVFNPLRYLDSEGKLKDPIPDTHGHSHGSFGSGRRICVGKDLAQQSLFINVTTILWGANISHAVDDKGIAVIPSADALVDMGIVVRPIAFPCVVTARSSKVRAMIETVIEDA